MPARSVVGLRRPKSKTVVGMSTVTVPWTPEEDERKPKSNARYRSFAERYVIERAKFFPVGKELEAAWQAGMEARSIYKMLQGLGRTIGDDE